MSRWIGVGVAVIAVAIGLWLARPFGTADEAPEGADGPVTSAPPGKEDLPGPDEVRPVPSDPDEAFEAAMAMELLPPTATDAQEAGAELQEQIRHLTSSIELAVDAQRRLARADPDRAAEATDRAVKLYEHAADQFESSPAPPLPYGGDEARYRKAMGRLAEHRRQKAQAIREDGL